MTLVQQFCVRTIESVGSQILKTFPNRHVVEQPITMKVRKVGFKRLKRGGRYLRRRQPPYEPWRLFGKLVDLLDPIREPGHNRLCNRAVHPGDVHLRQVKTHYCLGFSKLNILTRAPQNISRIVTLPVPSKFKYVIISFASAPLKRRVKELLVALRSAPPFWSLPG